MSMSTTSLITMNMITRHFLYIDNRKVRILRVGATRNGYTAVVVSADEYSDVPVAEHQLPSDWLIAGQGQTVFTGGHRYSSEPVRA